MNIQEILFRWNDFECSQEREVMLKGYDYFNGKNDITLPENGRYETSLNPQNLDEHQAVADSPAKMSDRRISHNFYKFIINQQVAYGIARKFVLTTSAIEELETGLNLIERIKSKIFKKTNKVAEAKQRFEELNILVSKTFQERYATFIQAETNAPKVGIGWLYVFYNEKGQLDFLAMNPSELCPIWKDENKKDEVSEMIRRYKKIEYNEEGRIEVEYIEHYGVENIQIYRMAGTDMDEPELVETKPYYTFTNGKFGKFPFCPFIPMKYNADGKALLQDVKELIDAYDKIQSEVADNIIDIPNSLTFISGFNNNNQDEVDWFCHNVKIHRFMFGPEGADAKGVAAEQNIEQIELTLTRIRKDIFSIGGGVDSQGRDLKDTSGVALRWTYSDLEEKFNVWSSQIELSIKKIIELIIFDNVINGGEDYSDIDYDIVFNTDSIINESETINNLVLSKDLISPYTIAINHPYTKNANAEIEGLHKELEFKSKLEMATKNTGENQHNTEEQKTEKSL